MNGRAIHLAYARYKGADAQSFIKVEDGHYNSELHYLDSEGVAKYLMFSYQDMMYWVTQNCRIELKVTSS